MGEGGRSIESGETFSCTKVGHDSRVFAHIANLPRLSAVVRLFMLPLFLDT